MNSINKEKIDGRDIFSYICAGAGFLLFVLVMLGQ